MSGLFETPALRDGAGQIIMGVAGEDLSNRDLIYLDSTGRWKKADADLEEITYGICMDNAFETRNVKILLTGLIGLASWNYTIGAPIYVSNTAGQITQTQPTTGNIISVGFAYETDLILFDPALDSGRLNLAVNDNNWEDLRFPASAIRLGGTAPPTFQAYKDSAVLAFASNQSQKIYIIAQIPHSWKEGDDIEIHLHWTTPVNGGGGADENVKWDLTYSWSNIGALIPNSSADTLTRNVKDLTANYHLLNTWGYLTGTGKTKSSILLISVRRDVSVANNYANPVYLMEVDIHYKQDKMGTPTIPPNVP